VHEHVAYHSLHTMHCIYVSVSYLHICDRSRGTSTHGATGASTSRDRWLRARSRQAPVHLTIILEFIFLFFFYLVYNSWMRIKPPLLHWLAQERRWVSGALWIVSGALLFQEQWACSTLSMTRERLPCTGTTRRKRTRGVRGLAWEAYMACWSGFSL
jgi:hypothetical protein